MLEYTLETISLYTQVSAKHRVVITNLNRPFYRSRFKWGRRI